MGGGLLLGLASDHLLATESATFRLGVAPHGLSPVVMATVVLPQLMGRAFASRMYMDDFSMDVKHATATGLVDGVALDSQAARALACAAAGAGTPVNASLAANVALPGHHSI